MPSKLILFLSFAFYKFSISAQDTKSYTWWNPAKNNFSVIEGQAWQKKKKNPYDNYRIMQPV